jgi:thioredoxin-dependent peroxiredoxin
MMDAMRRLASLVLLLAGCASSGSVLPEPKGPPEVGSPAPDFSLPGSDGKTHRLADYQGKQVVVLAWFPAAFTGG